MCRAATGEHSRGRKNFEEGTTSASLHLVPLHLYISTSRHLYISTSISIQFTCKHVYLSGHHKYMYILRQEAGTSRKLPRRTHAATARTRTRRSTEEAADCLTIHPAIHPSISPSVHASGQPHLIIAPQRPRGAGSQTTGERRAGGRERGREQGDM